jgi:DNA topoisomerase I
MPKKFLVIVESPTKAKTINKILGSKDYVVKASYGHVMDLPKSKIGVDIEKGFKPTYVPIKEKGKDAVIAELKKLANEAEMVYLCSDPDREGEFIAQSLKDLLGLKDSEALRVTYNEITPKAIKEAFQKPRKIDDNLVNSQQARRLLDRIVGYKLSPLLWSKILRGLSAGRVQSVAVRLVAEREAEIQAFKADEYWTVKGNFCQEILVADKRPYHVKPGEVKPDQFFHAELREYAGKKVVSSAEDMEKSKEKPAAYIVMDKDYVEWSVVEVLMYGDWTHRVSKYETKETKQHTVPPFSTSYLQQAAANRLGFDTKRTMGVAQKLYEGIDMGSGHVGLITYMRTDSFSVSKDAQEAAKQFITCKYGEKYYPDKPNYFKSKKGSQEAHECIRPTHVEITPAETKGKLGQDEQKLYELIWCRFVASQMAPAVFDSTTCEVSSHKPEIKGKEPELTALWRANGRLMKFDGWMKVYGKEDADAKLPVLAEGEGVVVQKLYPEQHFTQPPARFNEASLVKLLESEGIGRPSTYASIIGVIQDRGYVQKLGKGGKAALKATDLGIAVSGALVGHVPSIMDVGFTREMEEKLDEVEEGKVDYVEMLGAFYKGFEKELKKAQKEMPTTKEGWPSDHKCPKCSGVMRKRLSKFGFFVACQDEKCGTMANIGEDGKLQEKKPPEATGIKCDACGADVFYAKGRFGPYLHCSNYKNKDAPCAFTMTINKAGEPHRKFKPIPTDNECQKCKKTKLVVRVSNRGKKNNPFLSCPGFPKCRHAEDLPEAMAAVGADAMKQFVELREKDKHDLETFKEFMQKQQEAEE